MRTRTAAILVLGLMAAAATGRAAQFLVPKGRIPLPRIAGRIDHMAVDLARKRLFVAEFGKGALDVVGLATGSKISRIAGLDRPQGVGYAQKAGLVAVANGGDGSVRFYRGADLTPAGSAAMPTISASIGAPAISSSATAAAGSR